MGMVQSMSFDQIKQFEQMLAEYTGAPYAIMTDCCTHAIELALRYDHVQRCTMPARSYLSIPMTLHKLNIQYDYTDTEWTGEYQLGGTRIWDSARRLERGMYRSGQIQCLSFGHGKPLQIGRGGAILLDDKLAYNTMLQQRYDGRDLDVVPWEEQRVFRVGYHYKPTIEEAEIGIKLLPNINQQPKYVSYPDLRNISITD
jgi:dTDP-4-amino-4,6-dideoxygalactose transaminase